MRAAMSKALVRIIDADRIDTNERVIALRLQAEAWRLLATIACHDPQYVKEKVRWLFFVTVPFVDGDAVRQFIEEHRDMAHDYGTKAGVFTA